MSKLRIIHTTDTHGYLTSKSFIHDGLEAFGLDRVASIIEEYRTDNTLLIDTGDTIQGSPFTQFYKSNQESFNNPISKVFNHLKYDYFVPGNHDFNYGSDYLLDFTSTINAKTLCNNVTKNNELYFNQGYDILKINEKNILIIGLTNNYVPNWENPDNIKDLTFINAFDSLKETLKQVKSEQQIDVTIVCYHGGFEKNIITFEEEKGNHNENLGIKMIEDIEGIDILLTGHQHRVINEKIKKTVAVMPGHNGSYVSVIDIEFDNSIKSTLVKSSDFSPTQEVTDLINQELQACDTYLDQVIGTNKGVSLVVKDRLSSRVKKHPVVQFINEVQLEVTNAQISGCALGNVVSGFNDVITYRDVLNTYIYPNTLVVLEISGKELASYLERNAQFFRVKDNEIIINESYLYPKLELYNYDMFDGIEYEIVVDEFTASIKHLRYNGNDIKDTDLFTLVINSYRYSGGDNTGIISKCKKIREISLDIREILIDYIENHKELDIDLKNNITVSIKKS